LSTYSDLGLELLEDVLTNVNKNSQVSNAFYARYHMKIVTDILDVMTDGFHRSGIDAQTKIFFILVHVTTQNFVSLILYRSLIRLHLTNHHNNLTLNTFITS
jgi:hypothetical protein